MEQLFGSCRWVYNWGLQRRHETYISTGKSIGWGDLSKELTQLKQAPETAWLADMPAWSLQQPLRILNSAFDDFFKKKSGYPKFKKRGKAQNSFRNFGNSIDARGINMLKLGNVKVKWHRQLPADAVIKTTTMTKDKSGRYFVSINFETAEKKELPPSSAQIGVDLGLTHLAILSTGEKIENPRWYRKMETKLKREQRRLSRKKKGSKNKNKQRLRQAKTHARIADQRKDYLHKVSSRLVSENQAIAMETLYVQGMSNKKRNLGKSFHDAGLGEFRRMVEYKCAYAAPDREFLPLDRFFPSSKTCSECLHLLDSLPLHIREWACPSCGTAHDRDVNAAKNILAAGLAVTAFGGIVSPVLLQASPVELGNVECLT